MSFTRKAVAVGVAAAATLGAIEGYEAITSDNIPSVTALGELPPEVGRNQEGLICAEDAPCDREHALAVVALKNQVEVDYDDLSPHLIDALVAAEDRRFWEHDGVDGRAIARASVRNARDRNFTQGGSTIDRQYASLMYGTATQEQLRDLGVAVGGDGALYRVMVQWYEARVALTLNRELTQQHDGDKRAAKEDIITGYLNHAYMGRGAYGAEAAALAYYGKSADELTLPEAAMLVATLRMPDRVDVAFTDPSSSSQQAAFIEESLRLRDEYFRVINALEATGKITGEEANAYKYQTDEDGSVLQDSEGEPLPVQLPLLRFDPSRIPRDDNSIANGLNARFFVNYARAEAARQLGSGRSLAGLKIITTLRTADQRALADVIADNRRLRWSGADIGAVAVNADGGIAVMVGARDYQKATVNMATARRDAGSSLKGLVWAHAYNEGWNPTTEFTLKSVTVPKANNGKDWKVPAGHECERLGRERGCAITAEEALMVSSNAVAAQAVNVFGIENIMDTVERFGIQKPKTITPANVLGTGGASALELANAYNGLVVNKGVQRPHYAVSRIVDSAGATIYEHENLKGRRVVSREAAVAATQSLKRVNQDGTAAGAIRSPQGRNSTAGKTGTANNTTDLRYTGSVCDPEYGLQTMSIEIGYPNKSKPVNDLGGSIQAARLFGAYVQERPHSGKKCDISKGTD